MYMMAVLKRLTTHYRYGNMLVEFVGGATMYKRLLTFLLVLCLTVGAMPNIPTLAATPQHEPSTIEDFYTADIAECECIIFIIVFFPNLAYDPNTLKGSQPDPHFHALHGNLQNCHLSVAQAGNLYMFVIHNPVRFIDPTGLILQLASNGFDWAVPYLFDALQSLTNDTLHRGDRGFITITNRVSDDLITLAFGTRLLRSIIDNPNDTVRLQHNTNVEIATVHHDRNQGRRSAHVNIDLNRLRDSGMTLLTLQGGNAVPHTLDLNYLHIVIAHELIHADRRFTGNTARGRIINIHQTTSRFGWGTEWIPLEEFETIGILHSDPIDRLYGITENHIRAEHGIPRRITFRAVPRP